MTSPGDLVSSKFEALKRQRRRVLPLDALAGIGELSTFCLQQLQRFPSFQIPWSGSGDKVYIVFEFRAKFSRAINAAEFEHDPKAFSALWASYLAAIAASAGKERLCGIPPDKANRAVYTALMAFAAFIDLIRPNNGQPGTYLEMIGGPTISQLIGRPEMGAIQVPIPGTDAFETVTVDLSFPSSPPAGEPVHWLVLPTKISTRERISQVYVHHRILTAAGFAPLKTVLCAVNETNKLKGGTLTETLVGKTIALYERYVAHLSALIYLDPPKRYLDGLPGMPKVMNFGDFIVNELPANLR